MRHRCPRCGALVLNRIELPRFKSVNVMLPLISNPDEACAPRSHIFYAFRSVDVNDDLPKYDELKPRR